MSSRLLTMKKLISVLLSITIILTFVPLVSAASGFTDVPQNSWYANAVEWAVSNGITNGTSNTTFSPNAVCTRAELITFLWRFAGSPEFPYSELSSDVTDIPEGKFYTKAFVWAAQYGIIYPNNGKMSPSAKADRKQFAYCSHNCAVYLGLSTISYEKSILNYTDVFQDVNKIPGWAQSAVSFCIDNGIIMGKSKSNLALNEKITRAEAITMIYRLNSVKECGGHDPVYKETVDPTCTLNGYDRFNCSKCGMELRKNFTAALGHDYSKASLISDATFSSPTKYCFVCSNCGNKSTTLTLGKKILNYPNPGRGDHNPYNMLQWNANTGDGKKTITLYSGNNAKVTLTRKWFGSAWVYIADIYLMNSSAYQRFHGFSTYDENTKKITRITAYDNIAKYANAIVMVSGDCELYNEWGNIRGGVIYGTTAQAGTSAPASYWNPSNGTFGALWDLGLGNAPALTKLKEIGITDTIRFGGAWIKNGKLTSSLINSADCDQASYEELGCRRQAAFMGFKKEGSAIHIYLVVSDGNPFTNAAPSSEKRVKALSSDAASYGLSMKEKKILMSTLGCDYAIGLDGGGSTEMAVRYKNKVYQVNGITNWQDGSERRVWDFFSFEK